MACARHDGHRDGHHKDSFARPPARLSSARPPARQLVEWAERVESCGTVLQQSGWGGNKQKLGRAEGRGRRVRARSPVRHLLRAHRRRAECEFITIGQTNIFPHTPCGPNDADVSQMDAATRRAPRRLIHTTRAKRDTKKFKQAPLPVRDSMRLAACPWPARLLRWLLLTRARSRAPK